MTEFEPNFEKAKEVIALQKAAMKEHLTLFSGTDDSVLPNHNHSTRDGLVLSAAVHLDVIDDTKGFTKLRMEMVELYALYFLVSMHYSIYTIPT